MTEDGGQQLGFVIPVQEVNPSNGNRQSTQVDPNAGGVKSSLWPERWPAIALQECIDKVQRARPKDRLKVRRELPCQTCPKNGACLNAKQKELGSLLYGREILTWPRASEASLFPREIWDPMLYPTEALVPYWHKPFSLERDYGICQAWDIAWSEKIGGDWLVCMTAYVHRPTGKRRLLDIERWQQKTFKQQTKLIKSKWHTYRADLVVIEADGAQQVWSQRLRDETAVPVLPHWADQKRDYATGVPGLLILLENDKWEIPWTPGSLRHEEVENMLDEHEAFSFVDGKLEGVGEHDDTVMCFWHLNWGLDRLLHFGKGGQQHHAGVQDGKQV